jgi:hypothetical protein
MNESLSLRDASVQDIQLELLRRTRFNALDGEKVSLVESLFIAEADFGFYSRRSAVRQRIPGWHLRRHGPSGGAGSLLDGWWQRADDGRVWGDELKPT